MAIGRNSPRIVVGGLRLQVPDVLMRRAPEHEEHDARPGAAEARRTPRGRPRSRRLGQGPAAQQLREAQAEAPQPPHAQPFATGPSLTTVNRAATDGEHRPPDRPRSPPGPSQKPILGHDACQSFEAGSQEGCISPPPVPPPPGRLPTGGAGGGATPRTPGCRGPPSDPRANSGELRHVGKSWDIFLEIAASVASPGSGPESPEAGRSGTSLGAWVVGGLPRILSQKMKEVGHPGHFGTFAGDRSRIGPDEVNSPPGRRIAKSSSRWGGPGACPPVRNPPGRGTVDKRSVTPGGASRQGALGNRPGSAR